MATALRGERIDDPRAALGLSVEPGRTITPGYGTVAAMPEITDILSPGEVRDVVAFLASLNDPRSIRPEGAMIRPVPVAFGISLHVAAVVLAVILAAARISTPMTLALTVTCLIGIR